MELHLAPLENVSAWAFRKLFSGATDSYTGMLSLNNLVRRKNTWEEIDTYPIEGQRQWIQVATSKEKEISAFFRKLEEEIKEHPEKDNIYGIQLNCSCPSPDLIRIGQGPALIKRTAKVCSLVRELLKQDTYKVGIKLRLGLNETEVKQGKILTLLAELEKIHKENPRFSNVTIHFKHAKQRSSEEYDYGLLDEICSFELPLVINGGIRNLEDIKHLGLIGRPNVVGVMIGREAMNNPNCFLEILDGKIEKRDFNDEFLENCKEHMPKEIYLKTIKEKCEWAR